MLPNKPSELITLALKDLAKVERSPKFKVSMDFWVTMISSRKTCYVCLAGAVMVKTCKVIPVPQTRMHPWDIIPDSREANKLEALNDFREGRCGDGFGQIGLACAVGECFSRDITEYGYSRTQFKKDMRKLAKDLAKAGY